MTTSPPPDEAGPFVSPLPGRRVVCRVRSKADRIEFTWSEGSATFEPFALHGELVGDLQNVASQARDQLRNLVGLYAPPPDRRDAEAIALGCHKLARSGKQLFDLLFDRASLPNGGSEQVRKWLAAVTAADEVESLEVVSDGEPWFVPWNVVYDVKPPAASAFQPEAADLAAFEPFWGLQYNLCGGIPVDPLRHMRLPSKPDVLVVTDPLVLDDLARHSDPDDPGRTLKQRLETFILSNGLRRASSRDELADALDGTRPHLIYWLGHAEPDALYLGDDRIDLGELRKILRGLPTDDGPSSGLVYLNACRTAERSVLGSFLKTFHDYQFSGVIATEEQTLDTFACPFGLNSLEGFLLGRKPIGRLLRSLRRENVPLGLLYGTYCPPNIQVQEERATGGGPQGLRGASLLSAQTSGVLGVAAAAPALLPLPPAPYLPLGVYGPEHRALFAGRDDDVERFALTMGRAETRCLVLHGESGVGKSSFLRAGLIPFLEDECIGYQFLRGHDDATDGDGRAPVVFVRATDDLAGQLAQELWEYCERPYGYRTPTGRVVHIDLAAALARGAGLDGPVTRDAVHRALADPRNPTCLGRMLAALAGSLPFTLAVVIDQAEEVFTLSHGPDGEGRRAQALRILSRVGDDDGDYKVILSLRTEYYGRLVDAIRRGRRGRHGVQEYLLTDLDRDAIVAAIMRPTSTLPVPYASEIPVDLYRFRYAEGVPEVIAEHVSTAGRRDGVLPLMQLICAQLYDRLPPSKGAEITFADFEQIGGLEGGLYRHVENLLERLFPTQGGDRQAFRDLLSHLCLTQVDGTLTTALVREDVVAGHWRGATPFPALLVRAVEERLLRVTTRRLADGREERLVSLGHDALAKVAARWAEEKSVRDAFRKKAVRTATFAGLVSIPVLIALAVYGLVQASRARSSEARAVATSADLVTVTGFTDEERGHHYAPLHHYARAARIRAGWAERSDPDLVRIGARSRSLPRLRATLPHDGFPTHAAFKPDGLALATTADDGRTRLWDVTSGRLLWASDTGAPAVRVAFSPKGDQLVTASLDGTARVRESSTGRELSRLDLSRPVRWAEFNEGGNLVATACDDGTARVWDVAARKVVSQVNHGGPVEVVRFGPGDSVIAASSDGTATAFGAGPDTRPRFLRGHGGPVRDAFFAAARGFDPDRPRLPCVTASDDGLARVWDADSGRRVLELSGHYGPVRRVGFSPDGRLILTSSDDRTVRVWNAESGEAVATLRGPDKPARTIEFSPDGRRVLAAYDDAARVWDVSSALAVASIQGHGGPVRHAGFAPNGRTIVTASADRTARLWDWDPELGSSVLAAHRGAVEAAALSPDGRHAVTASGDGAIRLGTLDGAPGVALDGHAEAVNAAAFSPDGSRLVTASDDETARVWLVDGRAAPVVLKGHTGPVRSAEFSRDGTLVVTASWDRSARVWGAKDGRPLVSLAPHAGRVEWAALDPSGRLAVTAAWDGTATLWDVRTGQKLRELRGHMGPVYRVSFDAPGAHVVTASADGKARVWRVGSEGGPVVLSGHKGPVQAAEFAPAGRANGPAWVVTASDDGTARVWGRSSETLAVLPHRGPVVSARFDPSGSYIVTASDDRTARVWDARNGWPVATLSGHTGPVRQATFDARGRVLTGSTDHTARLWDLSPVAVAPTRLGDYVEALSGTRLVGNDLVVLDAAAWREALSRSGRPDPTTEPVPPVHAEPGPPIVIEGTISVGTEAPPPPVPAPVPVPVPVPEVPAPPPVPGSEPTAPGPAPPPPAPPAVSGPVRTEPRGP